MAQIGNHSLLISGAGGYLAGELIDQLSKETDHVIYALTSNKAKLTKQFENSSQIKIISLDDFRNGKLPWEKMDTLIHCAFSRGFNSCEAIQESLDFTNSLFMSAYTNKISNIINISSQAVYGKSNPPLWHEAMTLAPESCYGIAKQASELITCDIKKMTEGKTKVTNLRIASITGGTDQLRLELVSKLVINAIHSEPIKVIGGEQVLSYIDIRDVCSGIIALLSIEPEKWREIYNLGSNQQHSISEIADLVIKVAEKFELEPVKLKAKHSVPPLNVGMDSSLFYQETGWKPQYTLEDTIFSLFEFFMKSEQPSIGNQVKT